MNLGQSFAVTLSPEQASRLKRLAEREGREIDALLTAALEDFLEQWEDFYRVVDCLGAGDDPKAALQSAETL